MKNVRMMLAAAAIGVSAMALPVRAADEFKETKMDSIPREAREALQDKTKNMDDVKVFTRHMKDGEDQYTAFYMDNGKRMEIRVDKDGKVTSPAHETREQPGDKDADKKKDDSSASNDKNEWKREPSPLKDFPKPAQETLTKELSAAGAKDGDYFRLRQQGDDIYSMFYTPEGGQRQEVRVDKNGKVIGHYGPESNANETASAKTSSDSTGAAQPAGAKQPANTSDTNKTTTAQPAPKTGTVAPAETEELKEIKRDDLPESVRKTFAGQTIGASSVEYRTWTRDGKTYYSVFYLPKGSVKQMEFRTDAEGKKLEDAHEAQAKK